MGKSREQKRQEKLNLEVAQQQAAQSRQAAATQQALLAQQQKVSEQISPFATSALNLGQEALGGKVNQDFVNAFLLPQKNELAKSFGQGRQNLIEALGQSGQYGSGISAAPLASFERQFATAQGEATANANLQALQMALGLGTQGANMLAGQQALFNPVPYGQLGIGSAQTAMVDPRQYASTNPLKALGGALGGAALGALNFGGIPGGVFK